MMGTRVYIDFHNQEDNRSETGSPSPILVLELANMCYERLQGKFLNKSLLGAHDDLNMLQAKRDIPTAESASDHISQN